MQTAARVMVSEHGASCAMQRADIGHFRPGGCVEHFLQNGAEGDRLINVVISRAKAHVAILYHANDLRKPAMKQMHGTAAKLWQTAGDYAAPFTFR